MEQSEKQSLQVDVKRQRHVHRRERGASVPLPRKASQAAGATPVEVGGEVDAWRRVVPPRSGAASAGGAWPDQNAARWMIASKLRPACRPLAAGPLPAGAEERLPSGRALRQPGIVLAPGGPSAANRVVRRAAVDHRDE